MTVGSIEGRASVATMDEPGPALPVLSSLDLVIEEMLDRNEEARSAERLARDANREARTSARMEAIGHRREAADFALASGVVGGAVKVGSAAVSAGSAVGGTERADSTAGSETPTGEAPTTAAPTTEAPTSEATPSDAAPSAPANRAPNHAPDVAKGIEGVGGIATSALDRLGASSRADAEVADAHAETLGELADDRSADRSSALSHAEKELDLYARILEAQRRAEEAATRA